MNSKAKVAVLADAGPPRRDDTVKVMISQEGMAAGVRIDTIEELPSRVDPGRDVRDTTFAYTISAPLPTDTSKSWGEKQGRSLRLSVTSVFPDAGP